MKLYCRIDTGRKAEYALDGFNRCNTSCPYVTCASLNSGAKPDFYYAM